MRREEAEGQTKYKSEVCEHRGDANAFLATLGQASPGPDIGADASDTRPEHRHHSRLAMHTRCARLGAGASDIRSWSTDTIACGVYMLRKTLASGDSGDTLVRV